jgi:hypothetical protein
MKEDPPYIKKFKENTLEQRLNEIKIINKKYLNTKIPIIVDTFETKLNLKKHKYLVPKDLKMSHFFSFIRKKISIKPSESLFILCNNLLVDMNLNLNDIYYLKKSNDDYLYFILTLENTFG